MVFLIFSHRLPPATAQNPATAAPESLHLPGSNNPCRSSKTAGESPTSTPRTSQIHFSPRATTLPRDRLFQLELWRRQATGTVAEILGKQELRRDIGNRLFMYRGDLTRN